MIIYLILTSLIIALLFFAPAIFNKRSKKKRLQQLRLQWGKPNIDTFRNEYLIEQFSILQQTPGRLSDQTISDIDLKDIFAFLDRTQTCVGQQYLYHRLLHPSKNIAELEELDTQIEFFARETAIREEIQLLLSPLQKHDAHYISSLLKDEIFKKPKWQWLIRIDTAVVIAMLILSVKFHVLLVWLMLPFTINMLLHLWGKNNASQFVRSFPQLHRLIKISEIACRKEIPFNKEKALAGIRGLNRFQKKFRMLNFRSSSLDEASMAAMIVIELFKALLLIEVHSFLNCIDEIQEKKSSIIDLFNFVGSIDMAISIASVRNGAGHYCKPEFISPKKELEIEKVYHPLITDCTVNSLQIAGKSILITGSNMSGKTTFIRTVAINTILAQTIYTCFAESFCMPSLQILSSVRVKDDVLEGKSFYMAEVEAIHELIKASDTAEQYLFVLDEVFKGTNTIERIAAAKAILSYLNRNNHLVLVSTHDIELADLLQDEYDLYHFEEQVANNELFFDHLIKKGKLTKRNAIKILEISGYPESILEDARMIAGNNSLQH